MILETLTQADKQRCLQMLDGNARSDIELYCAGEIDETNKCVWYHLNNYHSDDTQIINDATWWCKKRHLFVLHPIKKGLVRFQDQTA